MVYDDMEKINYLPITQAGETRRRSQMVVLENPENEQPSIVWNQQDSILLANGQFAYTDAGLLVTSVTPELLETDIPEINIDTGLPTGKTFKGAELISHLQSLYIYCVQQ